MCGRALSTWMPRAGEMAKRTASPRRKRCIMTQMVNLLMGRSLMPDQPGSGWFQNFRQRWIQDVFTATVAVRLDEWKQIDDEALTLAAAWKREAAAKKTDDLLNAAVMDGVLHLIARTRVIRLSTGASARRRAGIL